MYFLIMYFLFEYLNPIKEIWEVEIFSKDQNKCRFIPHIVIVWLQMTRNIVQIDYFSDTFLSYLTTIHFHCMERSSVNTLQNTSFYVRQKTDNSYRFGGTWGRVNKDNIFISTYTVPLRVIRSVKMKGRLCQEEERETQRETLRQMTTPQR